MATTNTPAVHVMSLSEEDIETCIKDALFFLLTQEAKRIPVKKTEVFTACGLSKRSKDIKVGY